MGVSKSMSRTCWYCPPTGAAGLLRNAVLTVMCPSRCNRALLRGVIAAGNTDFGREFCHAGDVIAHKCGVPYLYRFELMGTEDDVVAVRSGLTEFWKEQTCHQPSLQSL